MSKSHFPKPSPTPQTLPLQVRVHGQTLEASKVQVLYPVAAQEGEERISTIEIDDQAMTISAFGPSEPGKVAEIESTLRIPRSIPPMILQCLNIDPSKLQAHRGAKFSKADLRKPQSLTTDLRQLDFIAELASVCLLLDPSQIEVLESLLREAYQQTSLDLIHPQSAGTEES